MFTEKGYGTAGLVGKSVNRYLDCRRTNIMPLKNGTNDTVTISRDKVGHSELTNFVMAAEVVDGSTTDQN